jgi:tRNA(Met) cytidine acetyltransferase
MTFLLPPDRDPAIALREVGKLRRHGHRTLFVVTGERQCGLVTAQQFSAESGFRAPWIITDQRFPNARTATLNQLLGHECETLIFDGFGGLNPDHLAAASGLVRAGGWLGLVLPEPSELLTQGDPDYQRMCRDPDQRAQCHYRFLDHLLRSLSEDRSVLWLAAGAALPAPPDWESCQLAPTREPVITLPTSDQRRAICHIEQMLTEPGHPLILSADRGRGKSAALGIAAARLVAHHDCRILLCAPSRAQSAIVMQHFTQNLPSHPRGTLTFVAPDALLLDSPQGDLLLVDEAAMLPLDRLLLLAHRYPRVVFASTEYGYEGSGRGFALRLLDHLSTTTAAPATRIRLSQPIRWCEHDALEQCLNRALLLDAEQALQQPVPDHSELGPILWLDRDELVHTPSRLRQLIGLLVSAHYQTRPSDLRLLLDHPQIEIGICCGPEQHILGAIVLLHEGGIDDADLAGGLIDGTRRPKGHLFPQAMTQFSGDPRWLPLQTWRITRIAVRATHQGRGIGTSLLKATLARAKSRQMDYLSTSFGLTAALLRFWHRAGFQLLRVGYRIDTASGCHSVNMACAIDARVDTLFLRARRRFAIVFGHLESSHFAALDTALAEFVRTLSTSTAAPPDDDPVRIELLRHYSDAHRSYEDVVPELLTLLNRTDIQTLVAALQPEQQALLSWRMPSGHKATNPIPTMGVHGKSDLGKRERDQQLRKIIALLCCQS